MKKITNPNFKYVQPKNILVGLLLGSLVLIPITSQAGFWDKALKFGKNLLATAAGNYTGKYEQDLSQLLKALKLPGSANQPPNQGTPPGNPYGQQQDPYAQQGYPNDPNTQQGYPNDPYAQQQNPYGQNDPYAQQGNPQDPYAQQQDPYAQQGYPDDPNTQQGYPNDPYAQQENPQDPYAQQQAPYAQQGYPDDPNTQQGYPNDPYAQQENPQDPYAQQQAPYVQQSYPHDPNGQTGYPGQGGTLGTPVGLDVAMVKKSVVNGAETMMTIKDGDVLKDGRGDAQAGDKFRIIFRANSDCYVYVIAIDGSAWAQGLFPSLNAPFANPVKRDQQYIIPGNNNWLSLDQFKGIETLFFVASPNKRQDIEDILATIAGKERHPKATPQQVTEAPIIPAGFHRSQPGLTPFIIGQSATGPEGLNQGLIPTTYFTQKAGEALRITRWFRHE